VIYIRSALFNFVFYVNLVLFLVLGFGFYFTPRKWSIRALQIWARSSLFWLRVIAGTKMEVRGLANIPQGPCLIPVAPGLMAPSGVLMIGAALVLRDAVQQLLGVRWALAAIACGVVLSVLVAPPALVIASATAFAIAELMDLSVYTPLRRRNLSLAVLASGIVGAAVDSDGQHGERAKVLQEHSRRGVVDVLRVPVLQSGRSWSDDGRGEPGVHLAGLFAVQTASAHAPGRARLSLSFLWARTRPGP
jgi:uncharacterized PurR-regulated membrane protein YhhQ (DUF165 family)